VSRGKAASVHPTQLLTIRTDQRQIAGRDQRFVRRRGGGAFCGRDRKTTARVDGQGIGRG
jgi:hypothetical protein